MKFGLSDQALQDDFAVLVQGGATVRVTSTPPLFIIGKGYRGNMTLEASGEIA